MNLKEIRASSVSLAIQALGDAAKDHALVTRTAAAIFDFISGGNGKSDTVAAAAFVGAPPPPKDHVIVGYRLEKTGVTFLDQCGELTTAAESEARLNTLALRWPETKYVAVKVPV